MTVYIVMLFEPEDSKVDSVWSTRAVADARAATANQERGLWRQLRAGAGQHVHVYNRTCCGNGECVVVDYEAHVEEWEVDLA